MSAVLLRELQEVNSHICPVCLYPHLEDPPQEFSICPCCGTEFGVDDFALAPEEVLLAQRQLRWRWLQSGAAWFDPGTPQPAGWSAYKQVLGSPLSIRTSSRDVAGTNHSVVKTYVTRRPARVLQIA